MRQRSFDDEFKKMDVELSKLKGSVKEAAEELNIDPSLLSKWRNRAEFNAEKVMMEIRRLKKVLKNAELERDIFELRRVYPNIPNSSLQELIQLNKTMYPGAFIK